MDESATSSSKKQSQPTITIKCGFALVICEHYFRKKMLENGQELVKAEHIFDVKEERGSTGALLHAKCVRATTIKEFWNVEIEIDQNRRVVSGHCQCFAGISGQCKHGAALCLYINKEQISSSTSKKQEWKKPSEKMKSLYPKGATMEEIVGCSSTKEWDFHPKEDFLNSFCADLQKHGLVSASALKTRNASPLMSQKEALILSPEQQIAWIALNQDPKTCPFSIPGEILILMILRLLKYLTFYVFI